MAKKDGENSLKAFSDALNEQSARKETERQAFNKALGEPAVFVPNEDDPRFGVGFWKAEGGVVAYRKYANGYDPYSRHEYDNKLIEILNKVK